MLATCIFSAVCLLYENVFRALFLKGSKMNYDDYSCIKEITKNVPITLSTAYQGNEINGISIVLDSWNRQYIQQLQGVVVSYRNVTLMSKYAYIRTDYPTILCNVKATFELFIPTVGSIVKGKVNRISHDYIGCLVHNSINVAIDRSHNKYDNISIDQVILFEITHIGFKRKIIRVKGKITQECVTLMKNIHSSIEEIDTIQHNIFTSPQESRGNSDSEEHGKNNDRDLENENMSESLLCDNINLFGESLNDIKSGSSTKKKKKSNKLKTEQSHNTHFKTLDIENGELSPSLLGNSSSLFSKDLNNESDPPQRKKGKSNIQIEHSNFKKYEHTVKNRESTSPKSVLNESVGLLGENSTDKDSYHSKKKKKKTKEKLQTEQRTDELLVNTLSDISPASNFHPPKKKKSKKVNDNSSDIVWPVHVKEEYSTDVCTDFSFSPKKKKHKKSKSNTLSSPPLFSDSQSSSKEEIKSFKILKSSPKKQQKVSQDKCSATEKKTNLKDFNSSLYEKDILNPLHTSVPLQETDIKTENLDNLIEALASYDPSLGSEMCNEVLLNKCLDSTKKAKKRKHMSPDRDGLPKKRKKIEEKEDSKNSLSLALVKSSDKHKMKKKSKEKSEKDSKKDKKISKKRVISSKKRLPKLKKKKKEKGEKLKRKKNLKKSKKNMP